MPDVWLARPVLEDNMNNDTQFIGGVEPMLELFGFFIVFGLSVTVKATSSVYAPCKAVLCHKAH